jgi:hypothetical protein
MTAEELQAALKEAEQKYELERIGLFKKFCEAKNPYKIGDVFTDHIGSIRIQKFRYSISNYPVENSCMIYEGIELKKDGTPKKNNPIRRAWQSNEIINKSEK